MTHDSDDEHPALGPLPRPTLSEEARTDILVALRPLASEVAFLYATRPDAPSVYATTAAGGLHVHHLSGGRSPQHGCAVIVTMTRDVDALRGVLGAALQGMAEHAAVDPIDLDAAYLLEVQSPYRASRGRWWCPGGSGYTDSLLQAGVFTEAEAQERAARSDRSTAVPLLDILALVAIQPAHLDVQGEWEGFVTTPPSGSVAALLQFDLQQAFAAHVRRRTGWAPPSTGA